MWDISPWPRVILLEFGTVNAVVCMESQAPELRSLGGCVGQHSAPQSALQSPASLVMSAIGAAQTQMLVCENRVHDVNRRMEGVRVSVVAPTVERSR